MHGYDGMLISPAQASPVFSLLVGEAIEAHNAAREILRRYANSNSTSKSFWRGVMSGDMGNPLIVINGESYRVEDKENLKRIYDLFLIYATAEVSPKTLRALSLEDAA